MTDSSLRIGRYPKQLSKMQAAILQIEAAIECKLAHSGEYFRPSAGIAALSSHKFCQKIASGLAACSQGPQTSPARWSIS